MMYHKSKIHLSVAPQEAIDALKRLSTFSFITSFQKDSFRFAMQGQRGLFRVKEALFVVGKIETTCTQCYLNYLILPSVECGLILGFSAFVFFRSLSIILNTGGFWWFPLIPIGFILIAVGETVWQIKECTKKIQKTFLDLNDKGVCK